jgi:uncharacterized protein (TIGR02996 family)
MIEGGIGRLVISLLAIGLVYRIALKAVRRRAAMPVGGLTLGALFGFTAIIIHSIGDFGLHLPAIAFLATVLVAHLVSRTGSPQQGSPFHGGRERKPERQGFATTGGELQAAGAGTKGEIVIVDPSTVSEGVDPMLPDNESPSVVRTDSESLKQNAPDTAGNSWPVPASSKQTGPEQHPVPLLSAPSASRSSPAPTDSDTYLLRLGGIAPVALAVLLTIFAAFLFINGWRLERMQTCRVTAQDLQSSTDPEDQKRQEALLLAASKFAPSSIHVQHELAEFYLDRYRKGRWQLLRGRQAVEIAQFVLAGAPSSPLAGLPGEFGKPNGGIAGTAWSLVVVDGQKELARRDLTPALHASLQARDLCPLMFPAHLRLAIYASEFDKADPRSSYLDRTKRLVTNNSQLWFMFGQRELLDGQRTNAAQSWRRSLELGDSYLLQVVDLGRDSLGPEVLLNEVLPERADLLVMAAVRLYPSRNFGDIPAERHPFYEKALRCVQAKSGSPEPKDHYLEAHLLRALGQREEGLEEYRLAVLYAPQEWAWRLEYADALQEAGHPAEARKELVSFLQHDSRHPLALALLRTVDEKLRQGMAPMPSKN